MKAQESIEKLVRQLDKDDLDELEREQIQAELQYNKDQLHQAIKAIESLPETEEPDG